MQLFPIVLKNTRTQEIAIIYQTKVEFYKLERVFKISDPVGELEMDLGSGFYKIKQSDIPTNKI